MDDMYKSIKAFLYDRTSSPLFGAFIISWSVINYRVILTIFSSEGLANKFAIIDQLYSVTLFEQSYHFLGLFYYGFMLPALATVSYIYLYPFLAKPVYEHSLKKQKELREIKQKEEALRLLSQEESQEIYREMAELENKYNQQEEKHRKQVSSLLSKNKELENKYNQQEEKHRKQVAGLISKKQEEESLDVPSWIRHQADEPEAEERDPTVQKSVKEFENKTTKVHTFDRAKLKKYNIKSKIDQLPTGNFSFEQLMGKEDWAKLPDGEKRTLGKVFNQSVKAGEYLGVSYEGEDASNHARYKKAAISKNNRQKETEKLSQLKEEVLKTFVKHKVKSFDKGALNIEGVHPIELELAFDELSRDGYITISTDFEGTELVWLTEKARKYVVDNKML